MTRPGLAAALAVAAVLFPGLAAAAGGEGDPAGAPVDVRFRVPAQARGGLDLHGLQWALLVFGPGESSFTLDAPAGGTATSHRTVDAVEGDDATVLDSQDSSLPANFNASARFHAGRPGSLFIMAKGLDLRLAQADASLGRASAGDAAGRSLPNQPPNGVIRRSESAPIVGDIRGSESAPIVPTGSAVVAAEGTDGEGVGFWLTAVGVRRLEWFNATVACRASQGCPDEPAYQSLGGPAGYPVELRSYTELRLPSGTASGSGSLLALAAGGPSIDLAVDGTVRLPAADAPGLCADCPAGQTLRATGALRLQGLAPDGGRADGLEARMTGASRLALDEDALPSPWVPAAVAGGALAGAAVALKLAIAFFTRVREDHPRARDLLLLIRERPGLSFRAILRETGLANGAARHHLARLLDTGQVTARSYRNTVRYFENHGRYELDWGRIVPLLDADTRRLHRWLLSNPARTQAAVVAEAKGWGWSRSKTQRRLAVLLEARLAVVQPAAGRRTYVAADPRGAPGPADAGQPGALAPRGAPATAAAP